MKSLSFIPHGKKAIGFVGMVFIIFLLYPCSSVYADFRDFLSKFQPNITLQEEYTDNYYLTHTNTQEDWITTVSPGLTFSTTTANSGIDLSYLLGLVFNAKHSEDNYVSHTGALNTYYNFTPRLTFRLRDVFIRSEEPRESYYYLGAPPSQFLAGTSRGREPYIRNVFEPSLAYKFGSEDLFELAYRNNIYRNDSPFFENSIENYINPRLTYWFNVRNGIILECSYTWADFERSPDYQGPWVRTQYNHRFNPHTTTFGEFTFERRDFDPPGVDYNVYTPSIGIDHAFSPTLTGRVKIGYFWYKPDQGADDSGPAYDASLVKISDRITYTIALQGGFSEDYFTAENLGASNSNRIYGSITHQVRRDIVWGMDGSVERNEYLGTNRREDWYWRVGGRASYHLFQWLFLSVEAYHIENDSNTDVFSYSENRGIIRIGTGSLNPLNPFSQARGYR
jgi:hypothetical protein